MKNQLIKAVTTALLLTVVLATTISAMEKEKSAKTPNITFIFTNESTHALHFKTGFQIEPNKLFILNPADQQWVTPKNPSLFIKMDSPVEKNIIVQMQGANKLLVVIPAQKIASEFAIDLAQSYLLPIKISEYLKIEIGQLEPEQTYHTQPYHVSEIPGKLNPKKIIIKGQEFQVPQELIKLRAPALEKLTE